MDYRDESLFTPRLFEGRIVKIDLANSNTVTNVTINLGQPVAVKFDSQGRLFALDALNGQVLRIDIDNPDPTSNSELVAQFPFNGVDNLAFDKDDRLYVSCWSTGSVTEVLGMTDFRSVSPGDMTVTSGIADLGGVIYTVATLAMYGYGVQTAEQVTLIESIPLLGPLNQPTSVVAMDENLALLSFLTNTLMVWDVNTNSALFTATGFEYPIDAHSFQGGMLVTEGITGNIVNVTGPDLASRTVIANLPGSFFLAGNDSDVYTSNFINGTIIKIIANGLVLDPPEEVSSGHANAEGVALVGDDLLVVATGSGTLEKVNLVTGEVTILADGLVFYPPLPDLGVVIGFANDVTVVDGYAYVNADGANVIYKVKLTSTSGSSSSSSSYSDENTY